VKQKIGKSTDTLCVHLQSLVEQTFEEKFSLEISHFLLFFVPIYFVLPSFFVKIKIKKKFLRFTCNKFFIVFGDEVSIIVVHGSIEKIQIE